MIKEAIGSAPTIDEARKQAIALLNAPLEADVQCEVQQMPKKKTLGLFGGAPAKVRAWYDDGKAAPAPKQEKPQPKPQPKPEQKSEPKPKGGQKPNKPEQQKQQGRKPAPAQASRKQETRKERTPKSVATPAPAPQVDLSGIEAKKTAATAYLEDVLRKMGVEGADVTCKETDDDIYFEINCEEDYGNIIGRRGETLDALQYLTRLFVNRSDNNNKRVALNVGDYRARREETLRALARRQASRAVKYGRSCKLEPMNPYERRIIHTAVQEIEGVTSHSVGEGDRRRVVIVPEGGVERPERPERGFDRRDRRDRRGRERREKYVPEIAEDREQKVDEVATARYGKIEPKFPPRKPAAPVEQVSTEEAYADLAPAGTEVHAAPAVEETRAVETPVAEAAPAVEATPAKEESVQFVFKETPPADDDLNEETVEKRHPDEAPIDFHLDSAAGIHFGDIPSNPEPVDEKGTEEFASISFDTDDTLQFVEPGAAKATSDEPKAEKPVWHFLDDAGAADSTLEFVGDAPAAEPKAEGEDPVWHIVDENGNEPEEIKFFDDPNEQ